jgi:hypothetical protein
VLERARETAPFLLHPFFGVKSRRARADSLGVTAQIGAPVRIAALVGLILTLGMATWVFALGRGHGSSSPAAPAKAADVVKDPVATAHARASKLDAHNRATAAGASALAAPHIRRAAATADEAPAVRRPHASRRPSASRQHSIGALLRRHRVVVVLLYDPQSKVDSYSVGEAQLGATTAHAAFLRVNVLNPRRSEPFAKAYRSLQTPTLLFFTRGGKVVQKLTGFADHESVAQAATNAAHGLVAAAG